MIHTKPLNIYISLPQIYFLIFKHGRAPGIVPGTEESLSQSWWDLILNARPVSLFKYKAKLVTGQGTDRSISLSFNEFTVCQAPLPPGNNIPANSTKRGYFMLSIILSRRSLFFHVNSLGKG